MFSKPIFLIAALAIGSAFFASTTAFAGSPYLAISALGNVHLFPDGVNILSFNLQSEGLFNPVFSEQDLIQSTFGVPGLVENTPESISWVSALAGGLNGFGDRPGDQAGADLGNFIPENFTGLTNNVWAGPGGTSGSFLYFGHLASDVDAGGPYTLDVGDDLVLDARGSTIFRTDVYGTLFFTLFWDLDLDGEYDAVDYVPATEQTVTNLADLLTPLIVPNDQLPERFHTPGTYEIELKGEGNAWTTSFDTAIVIVTPEPTTGTLLLLGLLAMSYRRGRYL